MYKCRLRRLLGKWNSKAYEPYIVNTIITCGSIEVKDLGDS